MTKPTRHPTFDEWLVWLDAGSPAEDGSPMAEHLEGCEHCRGLVSTVRDLWRAGRSGGWRTAPGDLVDRALESLGGEPAPPLPLQSRRLPWRPLDVRGHALPDTGAVRDLSRVVDAGEIGILATPPAGDGRWRLRGRVWLRKSTDQIVTILLVHGEHVLARVDATDGMDFLIDEEVAPGWHLEIRFPDAEPLIVEAPPA